MKSILAIRRLASLPLVVAVALLAAAVPATPLPTPTPASAAAEEPVPIADPVLLESLGFEPDATNVYAMPQVLREMAMDPAERAAAQETPEEAEPRSPFGTGTWGYSPVLANEFFPNYSSSEYQTSIGDRNCSSGNPYFTAQIESLPHGAKLQFVSLWFFDSSATQDFEFKLIRLCQPDNSGAIPSTTLLRTGLSLGSGAISTFVWAPSSTPSMRPSTSRAAPTRCECGSATHHHRRAPGAHSCVSRRPAPSGPGRSARHRRSRRSTTCPRVTRSSGTSKPSPRRESPSAATQTATARTAR